MSPLLSSASRAAVLLVAFSFLLFTASRSYAAPLTTLEYRVVGTQLRASPTVLQVPKGVAGSILVELVTGSSTNAAPSALTAPGSHFIEATLRGPSFPARRIVGAVNQPLLLPPLNLVGDYQLDQIRLVEAATGVTKLEATPANVPVQVFEEVLVSRVTSRPLTVDEIKERGIAIDEQNFRAVEFEVGFVLDGKTIPVKFPVIAPSFRQSTEIIPAAELEERLAIADQLNQQLAINAELPPELQTARVNISVQGVNFQFVEMGEQELGLSIPPIPALVVIPGNIGFLNQFFSVQIFTENAAPGASGLSVRDVQAELILPPGPDQLRSTNYSNPGDDPLRMARLGPDKVVQPVQPVVRPGPDGKIGTADDIGRLLPGESGQGEFFVEGLQEGLHVMDVKLTANLDGLAAGTVRISGRAAGSVLVRNPTFSMAFSHPRTIRAGEVYDAFVTILNTSPNPANLVQVTLPSASLSGGVLESAATVELGTILPGQTATARFRVRSQRTGAISFSNLSTGSDALVGRFRLRMGIDERGVALSPDTIGLPEFANSLPLDLLEAANRVLGHALSVSTAPQLPAGIRTVARSTITQRVLELAEAGQRLRYGDTTNRVLIDLLLDWQGGRHASAGFDQILRDTEAGAHWRGLLAQLLHAQGGLVLSNAVVEDIAGRSEPWAVASFNVVDGAVRLGGEGLPYAHTNAGVWAVARGTNATFDWFLSNGVAQAEVALALVNTNGTATLLRWSLSDLAAGSCVRFDGSQAPPLVSIDANCDGSPEQQVQGVFTPIAERAPEVIAVKQDPSVFSARPPKPCTPPQPANYGTVLGVLFSKPMVQSLANVPGAYRLENGNVAQSVQVQPGGRVALLNMRLPVAAFRPRTMTVAGITDLRSNALVAVSRPVLSDLNTGVALRGRVARGDGTPAVGVPVTLTMHDELLTDFDCAPWIVRVSQVLTDTNGGFEFDYVMSGVRYSVSATDTTGLTPEALQLIIASSEGDAFNRERLLEIINSAGAQDTLLQAFAVGALPQAIAKAEGLDRALLRDFVPRGSPREGSEVPFALRFRGRGTVEGVVVAPDGVTPQPGTAVNLFPDPDSRELGRGIIADGNGRFAFFGVPLGAFTVEATSPSGLSRTMSGSLLRPGESTNLVVVLSASVPLRTELTGRLVEADNTTPHPSGTVFVGKLEGGRFREVVAQAAVDAEGLWRASVPAGTWDVVGISADNKRKGTRHDVSAPAGVTNQVTVPLQGFSVVVGRVETSTGAPVTNALVGGGEALVRTGPNGSFRLTGVPTGRRTINAGLERNPAISNDFPRLGSASLEVIAGIENFVVVRLDEAGTIVGRVLDHRGVPMPNVNVAIPEDNGFRYVKSDARGHYRFDRLELKRHVLSAPAPVTEDTDVSGILETLGDSESGQDEILAAFGEALEIFTGVNNPLLNGSGANFNPLSWGFTEATLSFDGQVVVADVQFLPPGTISGRVVNGQGVPIGARVRLTGIGPLANGAPGMIIRGERNSDPATGTFEFPGQALAGDWGLQAASPFFPVVISTNGLTRREQPNETNVVLQFPANRDTKGRITGFVLLPDGSPAGTNIAVKVTAQQTVRTVEGGFFDTGSSFDPGGYFLEADDPATGLRGAANLNVQPGITNVATVRLLSRSTLDVLVLNANGTPAVGARVDLEQGSYPRDRFQGTNDASGHALFENIFEGTYGVCAQLPSGATTLKGRASVQVLPGQTNTVVVRLGPTGTIRGRFVKRDLITPVPFAQVAVGTLGFTTTDTNGAFRIDGVPAGTYRLASQDPVSGIGATLNVTIAQDGEVREVQLVEQSRATLSGLVINSYGNGFVPGAVVRIQFNDGLTVPRSVTTGPDGAFAFASVPPGSFTLEAHDPPTSLRGQASGVVPDGAETFSINVGLQPLAILAGTVLQPDGTPATNALVTLSSTTIRTSQTDTNGRVVFRDLPLGHYQVLAQSLNPSESRSVFTTNTILTSSGPAADFMARLRGVGTVLGRVFESDGVTPAGFIEVKIEFTAPGATGNEFALSDAAGDFDFSNVPVGSFRLVATEQALAASANGIMPTNNSVQTVNLTLGASGFVVGRLVRADGVTPVPNVDVLLSFASQSGLPGRAFVRTGVDGGFGFTGVPVGTFEFEAISPGFSGIARLTASLSGNGVTNNLGDVRLDEDDPRVLAVAPADTATGVLINSTIDLLFSEPMSAASLNTNGIYLRSAVPVPPIALSLVNDSNGSPRIVRVTPQAPLESERLYEVVVIDGERKNATGQVIASGPRDRVGRPLLTPFISSFTTADQRPPRLVSVNPSNAQVEVTIESSVRLQFDEAIRSTGFVVNVTGPAGVVAGDAVVTLNDRVIVFTPGTLLSANASYTATVTGVRDLAGNVAAGDPFTVTFHTVDTIGPAIGQLRIVDNRPPIAGSTIEVEAVLVTNEPNVTVRFTRDAEPLSNNNTPPFRASLVLRTNGFTLVRAIASDAKGNDGALAELRIEVLPNQPPAIAIERETPATGPVFRGEPFTVRVSATDDVSVTNVTVTFSAPLNFTTNLLQTNAATFTFVVPTNALPGSVLSVTASAQDFAGLESTAVLELAVTNLNHRPVAGLVVSDPGNALLFDGIDDRAFGDPVTSVSNDFTMELWVNPTAARGGTTETTGGAEGTGNQRYAVFPMHGDALGGGPRVGAGISVGTNGISVFEHAGFYMPSVLVHSAPVLGWTHIAVVYSNGQPRLYTNGVLARVGLRSFRVVHPSSGMSEFPPYGVYRGELDEFRIWSRALTEGEIQSRLAETLAGSEAFLRAYYRFDEAVGTLALNSVADTNHLRFDSAAGEPQRVPSLAPIITSFLETNSTNSGVVIELVGSDVDGDALTAVVVRLPEHGTLFATEDGVTAGAHITSVPSLVAHSQRLVFYRPQPGFNGQDQFTYLISDGQTNSAPAVVRIDVTTSTELDTDGDGMPDSFELTNQLNPEDASDAALDGDFDGLTNLAEFQRGLDPRSGDTDQDSAGDVFEVFGNFVPPIGWWRAEGNALDNARTNRGVLQGGVGFAAGRVGSAFNFNGTNAHVRVPAAENFDVFAFTIEGWVRTPGIADSAQAGFIAARSGPEGRAGWEFGLTTTGEGSRLRITLNGAAEGADLTGRSNLADNVFHHVAASYDGFALRLFLDGELNGEKVAPVFITNAPGDFFIGRREYSSIPGHFAGQVDELALHPSSLGPEQIRGIFQAGRAGLAVKRSDPLVRDTDGDSLLDGHEQRPALADSAPVFDATPEIVLLQHVTNTAAITVRDVDGNAQGMRVLVTRARTNNLIAFYALTSAPPNLASLDFNREPDHVEPLTQSGFGPTTNVLWPGGQADNFAARLTGFFAEGGSSNTRFDMTSDEGAELRVNGNLIVSTESPFLDGRRSSSGFASLPFGVHAFDLRYFDDVGSHELFWSIGFSDAQFRFLAPSLSAVWAESRFHEFSRFPATNVLVGHLRLFSSVADTGEVRIVAFDTDGLSRTQHVRVVVRSNIDGDLLADDEDPDMDGDGLANVDEPTAGTDPRNPDSDGDGVRDGYEVTHALNPLVNDAAGDEDGDGLSNLAEAQRDMNPRSSDTDGDLMPDAYEVANGLNPLVNDTAFDVDFDGLSNLAEFQRGTGARNPDSDDDGLLDGAEVAAGANPLSADSDGDGLPDGSDPNPAGTTQGVSFVTVANVSMAEGESTNVLVTVISSNAPLSLVDSVPGEMLPSFVSMEPPVIVNTETNGSATFSLHLHPLHDAAGNYTLKLRAAAADGSSGTLTLPLAVNDTPGLVVTRWKDPVDGSWDETNRWTAGVPDSNTVAVIDAPGTYRIELFETTAARGIVVASSNAQVRVQGTFTINAPVELRSGVMRIVNESFLSRRTVTLAKPVVVNSELQVATRFFVSGFQARFMDLTVLGGGFVDVRGSFAHTMPLNDFSHDVEWRLPLRVSGGATMAMRTDDGVVFRTGARLTTAGQVDTSGGQFGGGRVTVRDNVPWTCMPGTEFGTNGAVSVQTTNGLALLGSIAAPRELSLSGRVQGHGLLRLRDQARVSGSSSTEVNVPVQVMPAARVEMADLVFNRPFELGGGSRTRLSGVRLNVPVTIPSGAELVVGGFSRLTLAAPLTNHGVLSFAAASGINRHESEPAARVINHGLLRVLDQDTGEGSATVNFDLPVSIEPSGVFRLEQNSFAGFGNGGELLLSGRLEIVHHESRVFFQSSSDPASARLALEEGAVVTGGTLDFNAAELAVHGNATLTNVTVNMGFGSSFAGTNTLLVARDATLFIDQSMTNHGSIVIAGLLRTPHSEVVFAVSGALTLSAGGIIENPGTVLAGSFVNQGGTIIGNPPQVLVPFAFTAIRLNDREAGQKTLTGAPSGQRVVLRWRSTSLANCVLEASSDGQHWSACNATVVQTAPGEWEAAVSLPHGTAHQFFRLRVGR